MPGRKNHTVSEERFLDLIGQIYDAGMDASCWNDTSKSMADFFQAEQNNLRIIDRNSLEINQYYAYNRDPYWVQIYKDHFHLLDHWKDMFHNSDKPLITCTHHILSNREYRQTEFYNDYVAPTNGHYGMGGGIKGNGHFEIYFAMQRGCNRNEFHRDQLTLLKKLAPHITRATLINQRTQQLELQRNTLQQALNRISSAVFVVNDSRRVQFMNTAAESLLDQHPALSFRRGALQLGTAQYNQQLANLINNATVGRADSRVVEAGGMQFTQAGHAKGLSILVSPLSRDNIDFNLTGNRAAMVMISGVNETAQPAQEMLVAIYQLTESEAKVTSLLCAGLTLAEISEQLRLTLNTVKTHLKAVFQTDFSLN
ncbi:MAG: helix-turn-helix transcriptional regulator [Gammaproteobacteria bacterium]